MNETTLIGFHPDALNDKVRMYYNSTNARFASASGFNSAPLTHPRMKARVLNAGAKRVQDAAKDGPRFKALGNKALRGDTNTRVSTPEKRPVTYVLKPTPAGTSPGVTQGDEGNGIEKTVRFKAETAVTAAAECGPEVGICDAPAYEGYGAKKCCKDQGGNVGYTCGFSTCTGTRVPKCDSDQDAARCLENTSPETFQNAVRSNTGNVAPLDVQLDAAFNPAGHPIAPRRTLLAGGDKDQDKARSEANAARQKLTALSTGQDPPSIKMKPQDCEGRKWEIPWVDTGGAFMEQRGVAVAYSRDGANIVPIQKDAKLSELASDLPKKAGAKAYFTWVVLKTAPSNGGKMHIVFGRIVSTVEWGVKHDHLSKVFGKDSIPYAAGELVKEYDVKVRVFLRAFVVAAKVICVVAAASVSIYSHCFALPPPPLPTVALGRTTSSDTRSMGCLAAS